MKYFKDRVSLRFGTIPSTAKFIHTFRNDKLDIVCDIWQTPSIIYLKVKVTAVIQVFSMSRKYTLDSIPKNSIIYEWINERVRPYMPKKEYEVFCNRTHLIE